MLKELRDRFLNTPLSFIIIGSVTSIVIARTYVLLGGDLNLTYYGVTFHHFFIGAIIVAVIGIAFFDLNEHHLKNRLLKSLLAFIFGMGFGMIIDEPTLLLVGGQSYTLDQYYSPLNLSIEFGILALLVVVLLVKVFVSSYRNNRK